MMDFFTKVLNFFEMLRGTLLGKFLYFLSQFKVSKFFLICSFAWAMVRFGSSLFTGILSKLSAFRDTVSSTAQGAGAVPLSFGQMLALANYFFPVAEMLVLVGALGGLFLCAVAIRVALAIWHAIPFKAS